ERESPCEDCAVSGERRTPRNPKFSTFCPSDLLVKKSGSVELLRRLRSATSDCRSLRSRCPDLTCLGVGLSRGQLPAQTRPPNLTPHRNGSRFFYKKDRRQTEGQKVWLVRSASRRAKTAQFPESGARLETPNSRPS